MAEMKTLNGYEVVDAKARQDIEELQNKQPDLTGYATEEYVNEQIANIDIPETDLSEYAKKTEIPTVPTNVSAFNNDAGYLTEHQSLDDYATETYVDNAIENIDTKDSYHFMFTKTGEYIECDEEMTKFAEQIISGKDACAYIWNNSDSLFYPALIYNGTLMSTNQIQLVHSGFNPVKVISNDSLSYDIYTLNKNSDGIWQYKWDNNGPYTLTLATTDYVSSSVNSAKEELNEQIDAIKIKDWIWVDGNTYDTSLEIEHLKIVGYYSSLGINYKFSYDINAISGQGIVGYYYCSRKSAYICFYFNNGVISVSLLKSDGSLDSNAGYFTITGYYYWG